MDVSLIHKFGLVNHNDLNDLEIVDHKSLKLFIGAKAKVDSFLFHRIQSNPDFDPHSDTYYIIFY